MTSFFPATPLRWSVLLLLTGGTPCVATALGPYTPQALEQRFAEHSPELHLLRQEARQVEAAYRAGSWRPSPRLKLGRGRGEPLSGGGEKPLWELGLGLEMPNPVAWSARRRADEQVAQTGRVAVEREVRTVWKGFRERLGELEYLELRREGLRQRLVRQERLLSLVEGRVAAGEARAVDRLRMKVEVRRRQGDLALLEAERLALLKRLEADLSLDLCGLDAVLKPDPPPAPPPATPQGDLAGHPGVAGFRAGMEEARWRARQHRARSWLDGLELEGGRGREMDGRIWKVHLGLRLPLLGSEGREADLWGLRARQARLAADWEEQRLEAEQEGLHRSLLACWEALVALGEEGRGEARAQREVAEEGYRIGAYGLMVVLDAEEASWALEEDWLRLCLAYRRIWSAWQEIKGEHP